jgi:hypothetical protein
LSVAQPVPCRNFVKEEHIMRKLIALFIILLVLVPAVSAQDAVDVPLPDIPSGQQVTITYDMRVNDNLPPGLQYIVNQGVVTGSNFAPVLSDDPNTATAFDQTRVAVGFTLPVAALPGTGQTPLWAQLARVVAALGLAAGAAYLTLRYAKTE